MTRIGRRGFITGAAVPTLEDAGYKGLVLDAWYGAFVPQGTPPALIARLNAEMNKSLTDVKLLENFAKGAVEPIGGNADELGKLARADSEKLAIKPNRRNIIGAECNTSGLYTCPARMAAIKASWEGEVLYANNAPSRLQPRLIMRPMNRAPAAKAISRCIVVGMACLSSLILIGAGPAVRYCARCRLNPDAAPIGQARLR
jgi:Tripartite tricarboxylate transporter family receptor